MIRNIFELLGIVGFVLLIYSVCKYIEAKGNTKKADEMMQDDIRNAVERAGYIVSNDPSIKEHNEKNMMKRFTSFVVANAVFNIIASIIASIGVIIFFVWLVYSIKSGMWNGVPG